MPHGQTRLIRYGDANMRIKKNSPSHRKSFRARHHCSSCHDKLTATILVLSKLVV